AALLPTIRLPSTATTDSTAEHTNPEDSMKHRLSHIALLAPLMLLVACGKAGAPDAAESGEPVATVNGKTISQSEFDLYLQTVSRQSDRAVPDEQKPPLLDQYNSMKLAADAAEKAGVAKDPDVVHQLALA